MPSLRDAAEWVVKRISALTRTATDADLTDSEYMAVDDASAYTRKITVASLAKWILGKIKSLTATATEDDLKAGNYLALDGTEGTKRLPAELVAKASDANILIEKFENKYLNINNSLADWTGGYSLVTGYIVASKGDTFLYRGLGRSAAASVIFFNSSKAKISHLQYEAIGNAVKVTCPENTAYVRFAAMVYSGYEEIFDVCREFSEFYNIKNEIKRLESRFIFELIDGYINHLGAVTSTDNHNSLVTNFIPAKAGDVFLYRGVGQSEAKSYLVYNSQQQVIGYDTIRSEHEFTQITCPENTKYIRFQSYAKKPNEPRMNVAYVGSQTEQTEKRIKLVEDKVNDVASRPYSPSLMYEHREGFLAANGSFSSDATRHCLYTDFISAKEGDVYLYRGLGRSAAVSALFFDNTLSIIGNSKVDSLTSFTEITCPENTAYVRFCSFAAITDKVIFDIYKKNTIIQNLYDEISRVENEIKDQLNGKVWYVVGDSFSHGDFTGLSPTPSIADGIYTGQLPVYSYLIGNRTGCDVRNIAVNGSTLSFVNNSGFTKPTTGLLYTTDFSDADIITIYYGINDSHKNVPIGTIDDVDPSTFYGAWNVAISHLLNNYPSAKIGIIVSNGCDTAEYPTATEAIAKKWGLPYLDLDGGVSCTTMLRCSNRNPASAELKTLRLTQQRVSETNGHPNVLAHKLESTFIEGWLRSL